MDGKTYSQTVRINREVMMRIAHAFINGTLPDTIDRIPIEMRPKHSQSTRCCLYKDREIIKHRCLAALGFNPDNEELLTLREHALAAEQRLKTGDTSLIVLDVACSSCITEQYRVTDACRGCSARPCTSICPKEAVTVINGRAIIDSDKCVNCGRCVDVCRYHAIIHQPIPCEETCPVDAFTQDKYGQRTIDTARCIHCGKCVQSCPFGAILLRSQLIDVLSVLNTDKHVTLIPAPSIMTQYPGTWEQLCTAFKKAGFAHVIEVAEGARMTMTHESEEVLEHLDHGNPFLTTSCCPAWIELVNKHIPEIVPNVSTTKSPMSYAVEQARAENPDTVVVFAGPCFAKQQEAKRNNSADYVLTFEELGVLLAASNIDILQMPNNNEDDTALDESHGFALSGGVAHAVKITSGNNERIVPHLIDGITKKEIFKIKAMAKTGKCPGTLVEVMGCEGGCIAGPGTVMNPQKAAAQFKKRLS